MMRIDRLGLARAIYDALIHDKNSDLILTAGGDVAPDRPADLTVSISGTIDCKTLARIAADRMGRAAGE